MSSGCFSWCSLLMPWKFKATETKTEDLPENHDELPIVSTTNECTLVEDRAMETNSRAAEVPEIELVAIASTLKECTSVPVEDRVLQTLQTNSKAAELPENHELAILSTTNECTLVEDRVVETNSRAAERLEIEPVAIASTTKECTSVPVEDRVLQTLQTNSKATELPENEPLLEPAIVSASRDCTSEEDRIMDSETNSKAAISSDNPREVVPSTGQYIMATGKQALKVLQSAAAFIPVPLIREAIGVALKVMEVCEERCEDTSVVGKKVKELKDRVYHLSMVIVETFTPNNENGSDEVIVKAAKGIERDIKDLHSTLETISKDLDEIAAQGRWKLGIFSDLNTTAVDGCLDRLSTALENFKFSSGLRDTGLLQLLHPRLSKNQDLTQHVANKVEDVHEDVQHIANKVDGVHENLKILARSATLPSSDVQEMPLKPAVFHGRDVIIDEISQLLTKEETSRVCILGAGGMGKTSVSLGVVEQPLIKARFLPENIVWVPCIEATSGTLLLEILSTQLQVPGNSGQVTIEKIISLLDTSTQPRLILLDNFETPYIILDRTQKRVEDTLRRLAKLRHIAILVTMRGRYPPCEEAIKWQSKEIQPTDEAASLLIYQSIYPDSEKDPDVGRLLGVLGHMPFAVALMARLGKEGQSTAKELILAWSENGPDILPDHHEENMNRIIGLSVNSNLMKRNPQALLLLNVLSCLPAGTSKATLRWWIPALHSSMVPSATATLFKTGLLVENRRQDSDSPVLFVLPVVQSFMQLHGRIGEEIRQNIRLSCSQYVLDHDVFFQYDPAFSKVKALAAEDVNIQAILCSSESPTTQDSNKLSDKAIEALISFTWYRCINAKPNLEIAKHTVSMAKAFGDKKYIASSVGCLGATYAYLAEAYAAYDHLQEAYQLYNALLPGDRELQRLCCQCGIGMIEMARWTFNDVHKVVSLARDVEKQVATVPDDDIHARNLMVLGSVLYNSGDLQEALRILERAKLKAIASGTLGYEVYYWIAQVHYHEKRLPEALDAAEEAWKFAEPRNTLLNQAGVSFLLGKILFSVNRDMEAWKYMEISLKKYSELGNRRDSARALEYMGYGYLRRGDYLEAYGAYEAAAESVDVNEEEYFCNKCKDNMAKIKDMQENPDLNVGFKRPYNDINWPSLFYPGAAASE